MFYNNPCDFPSNHLRKLKRTKPMKMEKIARKVNITPAPKLEKNEARYPPIKFAKKLLNNQTPIMIEAKRTGDNFETMDNPIGDRHNSPNVWKR